MSRKTETPPTLFTKAEALNYAAERLERMVADLELSALVIDVFSKNPPKTTDKWSSDDQSRLEALAASCREPEIQKAAITEAAKAIRELAIEERLMNARATQHAATTRV